MKLNNGNNNRIMDLNRRRVLAGISAVGLTGIAGCAGGDDSQEDFEETPTDTPENQQHKVGESFAVGSGPKAIKYTVKNASLAREIGTSSISTEADGVFLVAILIMENIGDETIDVTSRHLRLIDSQDREFDADTGAAYYIDQDSRFNTEGITFEQLQPGLRQTRAIVFDVPSGESYALKVDPAGMFSAADTHYVALGNIPQQ